MPMSQHETGLSGTPLSALLHVDGTVVLNGTAGIGANVLLATGANDSSDWLRRNDSYTRTFCTRSNIARTDTDTVITDDAAMVSPGSARKQKKRERERIRFATMSIEERTERNTKERERYNIMKSAGLTFQSPVLGTKEPCFTQEFGLAPAIDEKDEVSRESIKKDRDRKRYAEMPPLLRHEKIVKTNEGRRQKNNYLTGEQINTPVTGNLQSVLTQQKSPPLTRARTRNVDGDDQFDSGLWEPDDPMHGVEENDFDQLNPEDYGPADIEDDEARVFHHQDFQYQYVLMLILGTEVQIRMMQCTRIFQKNIMF
ncbi:hypothetical protein PVAP13_7NG041100 [Panicum virgatum]|uniref:Uncharacterized protein n=1 Tax=Panicum virgatum TaxID=38727 RepID=A0A8T0Q548_PANVG|nr:hypothetical protein PVAP13_7NG041100 [Panicum virgatum]